MVVPKQFFPFAAGPIFRFFSLVLVEAMGLDSGNVPWSINSLVLGDGKNPTFNDGILIMVI